MSSPRIVCTMVKFKVPGPREPVTPTGSDPNDNRVFMNRAASSPGVPGYHIELDNAEGTFYLHRLSSDGESYGPAVCAPKTSAVYWVPFVPPAEKPAIPTSSFKPRTTVEDEDAKLKVAAGKGAHHG